MAYTSENTTVLATHEQAGGNTRMLLVHEQPGGRMEYVIGSYFKEETDGPAFPVEYSWDWGHYFQDVVDAVSYWKREVLGSRLLYSFEHGYEDAGWSDGELFGGFEDALEEYRGYELSDERREFKKLVIGEDLGDDDDFRPIAELMSERS